MEEDVIEGFRLSPQQRHVWLAAGAESSVSQCVIRIEGKASDFNLSDRLQVLTDRHESLRTHFPLLSGMDVPVQAPAPNAQIRLNTLKVAGTEPVQNVINRQLCLDAQNTSANEQNGSGRFTLLIFSESESVLLVTLPTLCADVRSLCIMFEQLPQGNTKDLGSGISGPDDCVQYADYSEWQNEILEDSSQENIDKYWEDLLPTGNPLTLEPTHSETVCSTSPGCVRRTLISDALEQLRSLCSQYKLPLQTALMSAFGTLAWRNSEQPSFTMGVSFDGRTMQGLDLSLGLYAKFLPVALTIEEDYHFIDVLQQADSELKKANAAQDHFPPGSGGTLPIKFEYQSIPKDKRLGPLRLSLQQLSSDTELFEIKLNCLEGADELTFEFHYDQSKYSSSSIERLADRFVTLLNAVISAPEACLRQLNVLPECERKVLLEQWNQTGQGNGSELCLHQLFERQAQYTPDANAVIDQHTVLSFSKLDQQANKLARRLRQARVGPEIAVGLCLERTHQLLVAILGIWKAGGVYVPIDSTQPLDRIAFIADDADCRVIVTQQCMAEQLVDLNVELVQIETLANPSMEQEELPSLSIDNLAYILYTSGSTGKPQGVMVKHRSVMNLALALKQKIYTTNEMALTIGLNAPITFDSSVKQLIQVLHGHCVCFIPENIRHDPFELAAYTKKHSIDAIDCTPSQLKLWLAAGMKEDLSGLPDIVLVGGEAIHGVLWQRLSNANEKRCFNVYGPTECTVDTTFSEIKGTSPAIGRPLSNVRTYVLDEYLNPVPIGSVGQLYIGGEGLARGYVRQPALTADRFVPDPFTQLKGQRLYRTGDLVKYHNNGELMYLRRIDHQVKVRGIRIELPEIEKVLCQFSGVQEAAVVISKTQDEVGQLVGYVLPKRHYAKKIDGHQRVALPNGKAVVHRNQHETEYLYQEIFEQNIYLRHGLKLPPNATVFDVGANIGMFSLFVAQHCPEADIYAFEPILPLLELCRINSDLYAPNVKLFPLGVSDRNETAQFTYYPHYSTMSGRLDYSDADADIAVIKRYLINQQENEVKGSEELVEHVDGLLNGRFVSETYDCNLRKLSQIIADENIDQIDLLKIDVQRAELDVLNGIEGVDWQKIQQMVLEVHDSGDNETAGRTNQISELLEKHGFETLVVQDKELSGTDRYNVYASRHGLQQNDTTGVKDFTHEQQASDGMLSAQALRLFLKEKLPAYMIPANLVVLDEMPLTRNGKVDRVALASSEHQLTRQQDNYFAPQTDLEKKIASIWQQLLGIEKVGLEDNFFDVGGHSLLLIQLHGRLCEELGANVLIIDVFQHPTVASMAELLQRDEGDTSAQQEKINKIQDRAARARKAATRNKLASNEWKNRL
ncbi:MAG TPA: hypothetical protein DCM12_04495 [Gammaproteobacteria bacterium]|nr:hypothetical protein [Gammaproteobacteria bacterium]